jgi:sugar phosphate isomerase/epimerase
VRRFAESVDEDNLGFVIDTWHFARSGQDFDALAQIPGERIFFVQLGDAAAVPEEDVFAETLGARVPPGEGVVDWPRLMATLDTMGVNCPMGTEMFSNAVKAMPLDEACAFLYSTMKKAFG